MLRVLSLLAMTALLGAVAYPADEMVVVPVHAGPSGKQAFDLLAEIYGKTAEKGRQKLDAAVDGALRELAGADHAKADEAGDFLLALFQQSAADERNGRAGWERKPWFGGGSESAARNFCEELGKKLQDKAKGDGAVPMALWLLREDEAPTSAAAAIEVLRRTHGERCDAALSSLVAEGVHFRPALVMALEQTGARKLAVKPEALQQWARDPREKVRTAARSAGAALGLAPPEAFKPEDGFGPQTAQLLHDIASLLAEPIGREAAFGRFKITRQDRDDEDPYRYSFIGWKLAESPDETRALGWHGEFHAVKTGAGWRTTLVFTALDPAGQVAEIARLRSAKGQNAREDLMDLLSFRGSLSGQFQSVDFTAPEVLLSAWLFDKGDLPTAGALLFPRLEALNDDRWPLQIARDLIGGQCHQRMLDEFAYSRDYAETLRLAKHLSQPVFDGYRYQVRAKELAAQLSGRMEDFKTFVLPTPEEWKTLVEPMTRLQQIEFLGARLRLLNCHQMGQPANIDYGEDQFRGVGNRFAAKDADHPPVPVINPWNELRALHLQPGDLAVLAPMLKDDNYLPTYSYLRDFHPDRTLHRVNWLVSALIDDAAKRELTNLREWQDFTPERRDKQIAEIVAWSREMAGKPASEVLVANMKTARSYYEWLPAASEAAGLKDPATLPALLAGTEKYPTREADIASLCRSHGASGAVDAARHWIKSRQGGSRLHGALILLHHGSETEQADALGVLHSLFAQKWDDELYIAAIQLIIDSGNTAAIDLACGLLRRKEFDWHRMGCRRAAHDLFLTGRPAALEGLLAALADNSGAEDWQVKWEGKDVTRKITQADRAALAISGFRKRFEYSTNAPDEERAERRKSLGDWLKTQAALRADGKPTPELDTESHPIFIPGVPFDVP